MNGMSISAQQQRIGRSTYAMRESLDDNEIWERLP